MGPRGSLRALGTKPQLLCFALADCHCLTHVVLRSLASGCNKYSVMAPGRDSPGLCLHCHLSFRSRSNFWTRPNDRMFMQGKQTALTSHALSDEKHNILRHIIQNRPPSRFDAQQRLTQTRAEDRSELHHNCSKQAQKVLSRDLRRYRLSQSLLHVRIFGVV